MAAICSMHFIINFNHISFQWTYSSENLLKHNLFDSSRTHVQFIVGLSANRPGRTCPFARIQSALTSMELTRPTGMTPIIWIIILKFSRCIICECAMVYTGNITMIFWFVWACTVQVNVHVHPLFHVNWLFFQFQMLCSMYSILLRTNYSNMHPSAWGPHTVVRISLPLA